MLFVAIGRSLMVFNDITFKMAARQPYCIFRFPDSNFSLLFWIWISSPNWTGTSLVCMGINLLIISNITFKMAVWWPYWIFQYLDSAGGMVSNSNLFWNFYFCMHFVCGHGPKSVDFQKCHFGNDRLVSIFAFSLSNLLLCVISLVLCGDQAAPRILLSVCLSLCLSIRPSVRLAHIFDSVRVIVSSWNF